MEKVLQELFGHNFLGCHTVQTVPKCIWMQHGVIKKCIPKLIKSINASIENLLSRDLACVRKSF